MSAPPERRRRKLVRKPRPLAERRRVDLARKHLQLSRERAGLCRVQIWLSNRALEGLVAMFIRGGKLTDATATDHRQLEAAIAQELEQQGARWTT
jgi:hypothetical protein